MQVKVLFELTLPLYQPTSQNSVRCAHWSDLHREKRRALFALRSVLESFPEDHLIGTTGGPKTCKTLLSSLDSYLQTIGARLGDGSNLTRLTRKPRKGRKSQSQ